MTYKENLRRCTKHRCNAIFHKDTKVVLPLYAMAVAHGHIDKTKFTAEVCKKHETRTSETCTSEKKLQPC